MKYLWLKWTILVWLNAIMGWKFGSVNANNDWFLFGMISGVCLFIPIYVHIEKTAIANNNLRLRDALMVAVMIRVALQSCFVVDIVAGMIAFTLVSPFGIHQFSKDMGFFAGFFLTVITGGVLSLVVAILTAIFMGIFKRFSESQKP